VFHQFSSSLPCLWGFRAWRRRACDAVAAVESEQAALASESLDELDGVQIAALAGGLEVLQKMTRML
jgi:hypothetical protein